MDNFFSFIINAANYLCGMPVLYAASVVSIILTISTRGFVFRHFRHIVHQIVNGFRQEKSTEKGLSSFSACCAALGNTLGVGNIAGIAIALASGGPGALFWIWIAGLLGVVIKYSEVILGSFYKESDARTGVYRGGIMYYMEKGLGKNWKWMAIMYALIYGTSNFIIEATQINSVVGAFHGVLEFPPIIVGILAAILIAFVLLGGIHRLGDVSNKIVPFAAILYVGVSFIVLLVNIPQLPGVLKEVLVSAFTGSAAAGGFAGASASMAIRYGIMRGFYSNGAASGDVAFAHSTAEVEHPVLQGMWGAVEVVVDTIVCSSTALVILTTGVLDTGLIGTALTTAAFSAFFHNAWYGALFVGSIIALFAFTTAMVCAYYGEVCVMYLIKNERISRHVTVIYRCLICVSAVVGSVASLEFLWSFTDFALAFCMFTCLFTLFMCRKKISKLTGEYVGTLTRDRVR